MEEAQASKVAAQSRFSSPIVSEVVMVDNYNSAEVRGEGGSGSMLHAA
jgi:hypothetical protein